MSPSASWLSAVRPSASLDAWKDGSVEFLKEGDGEADEEKLQFCLCL